MIRKITLCVALCGLSLVCAFAVAGNNNAPKGEITFAKNVAPIFQRRCEECHRAGGLAPMALVKYEEARPWARAIREKVANRTMPPFHASGAIGRYQGDPRLTDEEIATVTKWVDSGAAKGNLKDMPKPLVWKDDWIKGAPDLIIKAKQPYTVKPDPKDHYVFFLFDYVFPEDTWINTMETRPGNRAAVHHANLHLVPPGFTAPPDGIIEGWIDPTARGTILLSGWVPGVQPAQFREGTAIRIPKGMRLGIQLHYAPTDQERADQTSVGVYLANGTINKQVRVLMGDRRDLVIQPNEANYSLTADRVFDKDDALISIFHVHMHYRGKSYSFRFTYPDGRVETVLEVPSYSFNWQRGYVLNTLLSVPKGTKVEFSGTFDNSAKNKFNPDPTQTIKWGENTTNEMMQGRIFYEFANEKLNLQVKNGRAVTPTPNGAARQN